MEYTQSFFASDIGSPVLAAVRRLSPKTVHLGASCINPLILRVNILPKYWVKKFLNIMYLISLGRRKSKVYPQIWLVIDIKMVFTKSFVTLVFGIFLTSDMSYMWLYLLISTRYIQKSLIH